jgi:MFS family permease
MQHITTTLDSSSYPDAADRKRTMRLSIFEGIIALVMFGLIQNYYIPYLNALTASKLAIGIGFGTHLLTQGLVQIWSPALLRLFGKYKSFVVVSTLLQGLLLIPFGLVYYWCTDNVIWPSILLMASASIAGGSTVGVWADWMSHIVPRRIRGRYFSFRTALQTLSQLTASLAAAYFLDQTQNVIGVFTWIWIVAGVSRIISGFLFCWHYDPPEIYERPPVQVRFRDFVAQLHTHSYGKFILAYSLLFFGAYFSAPFFTLHMLNDLHFNYIQYGCVQLIAPVATILSLHFWGKICDRLGYVMPMRLTATVILMLPLGWLISGNFWYLLGLNVVGGLAWGGFTLTSFNYSIGELPSGKRLAYISYMNAIAAVFYFAGSALGGWIGPMLPAFTIFQMHSIFAFSALLRLPAVLIFQTLPTDEPAGTRMSAVEKFFFNPRRFISGRFTR